MNLKRISKASVETLERYPIAGGALPYHYLVIRTAVLVSHGGVILGNAKHKNGLGWYAEQSYPNLPANALAILAAHAPLGLVELRAVK